MLINIELVAASVRRASRSGITAALKKGPGEPPRKSNTDQREARYRSILSEMRDPQAARVQLERLIGGNDLQGISYLERGTICSRSVCRVHLRDSSGNTVGFGTGSLVAPGVLMTNHHVISSAAEASGATAEFNYELDVAGRDKEVVEFEVLTDPAPIAVEELDFCLVAVNPTSRARGQSLEQFGWLPLDPTPGKAFIGEYLTIIQHPGGERKQICVRENQLMKYDDADDTIWYKTDTVAGSSGSPVFNNSWQVVALHHMGVPDTDAQGNWLTVDGKKWDSSMDESRVAWKANEGIRISRIVAYLSAQEAGSPIAQAVLNRQAPPIVPTERSGNVPPQGCSGSIRDGELRVTIPIQVAVRVGPQPPCSPPPAATAPKPGGPPPTLSGTASQGLEAVVVDQSDYNKRPGFDESFLGSGKLKVPHPTLSAAMKKLIAPVKGSPDGKLKYWDYTVVLNKSRKLAFYSAVNVNAALRPTNAGRDGDRWYVDTRVDAKFQLDQSFYGDQKSFEAAGKPDRTKNPFDRGHLTRRLDAQWGTTDAISTRNGNDSFHFSNCSPQHWKYNQGAKKWLGLEDYVISKFAGGKKACVINGPVFDAPLSAVGHDGKLKPKLGGKKSPDPTFGGVRIPKLFFKIVACALPQGLRVAAFLMSQEDLLRTMGSRLKGLPPAPLEVLTDAEAKLYQVNLADIESLTGLGFGPLSAAAASTVHEALEDAGPRLIESIDDLRL